MVVCNLKIVKVYGRNSLKLAPMEVLHRSMKDSGEPGAYHVQLLEDGDENFCHYDHFYLPLIVDY